MNKECRFCGALEWKEESAGMCSWGVVLPSIDEPVEPVKELFSSETDQSRRYDTPISFHPRGEYERRFNALTTNEIAAIVVSSERTASRDIIIQAHDGRLTRVPDTQIL
ncbi:uncharacterized protein TNCV_2589071 [Trichonephila clavipes]|nr:uncharacterized protein TNCV_2589071 [Trichonephila clavipes]